MENSRQSKETYRAVVAVWHTDHLQFQACLLQSMAISIVITEEGHQDSIGKGKVILAVGNIVNLFLIIWTVEFFAMEKGEKWRTNTWLTISQMPSGTDINNWIYLLH